MLDQKKTGRFIAECRKEKGLTQRELAEHLSISDKTVSKWECGNGMPDTSLMAELCQLLSINVNELLSGERLFGEDYNQKAEENMMEWMKEQEQNKGSRKWTVLGTVAGLVLYVVFTLSAMGMQNFVWFLDMPSLFCVLGLDLLVLGLSGRLRYVCLGIRDSFRSPTGDATDVLLRQKETEALKYAGQISILAGISGSVIGFVMIMGHITDPAQLGPSLAVCILTIFYGIILSLIFSVFEHRCSN